MGGSSSDDMSISGPITLECYVVIADYKATAKTEISLREHQTVEVLEKNYNGQLMVRKF